MVKLAILSILLLCLPPLPAAELPGIGGVIEGTIVIKRKLTKRKVTATAGTYSRGPCVKLEADVETDPLDYERTHVVVYLDGSLGSEPVTASMQQKGMEQRGRRFVPELLVVPVGSTVSFPNLDTIFHNVFSLSKPNAFDLGNYAKDQTRTVTFTKAGVVYVYCHLHPNMAAAVVVTPNRWCTRADAAGRFVLSGVPAGQYTAVAWHKTAGFFRQTVNVGPGPGAPVQFVIPLEEAQLANSRAGAESLGRSRR